MSLIRKNAFGSTDYRGCAPGYELDDLIERRDRFRNELIIASHFSTRYHGKQIRQLVEQALPDMLDGRLHLWL